MSNLKRLPIKYIRDRAKSRYAKDKKCYICGALNELDFHHYYTLTPLLHKWLKVKQKENKEFYDEENILEWRDEFIDENHDEMFNFAVTICHKHHMQLHSVYGKDPALTTAKKQMRWVEIQREKHGLAK